MIKKLDLLIIRSFIGPFIVTFFIALFVLVMQFFWLYMDELLGKGLGPVLMLQLLALMSTTMVPLALPLAILLSSIMTFGAMGEHYELVAIKSSGISLNRFMRPLLVLIAFIGVGAFLFNNNVIPVANLKALSLLYDLRNSKPTLNIRPGVFNNDMPDYSIRIGTKDKDGHTIRDVIIYDGTSKQGNDNILLAESGEMQPSADKKVLTFRLRDGWRYQEGFGAGPMAVSRHDEQVRMHFKQYDKAFDLSSFAVKHTDQSLFQGSHQMMDVGQLTRQINTFRKDRVRDIAQAALYVDPYISITSPHTDSLIKKAKPSVSYKTSFAETIPASRKEMVQERLSSSVRSQTGMLGAIGNTMEVSDANLRKHQVALHAKFTLSFACVLLFLIGAPLGAIIRKGGLGLPIIVAIIFFVFYFFMTDTGKQLSESGTLVPWVGMWLSTAMLLPIAMIMVRAARNDSPLFTKDFYIRLLRRLRLLSSRSKPKTTTV